MSKLIIILAIVAAAGVGFLLWGGIFTPQTSPTSPTSVPTPSPVAIPQPAVPTPVPQPSPTPTAAQESTIEINEGGFLPSTITVKRGTPVRFINRGNAPHWPASGVHPIHQVCPGFDALKPIKPGESYSFTFTTAKTCPMHDHLNPSFKGSIVVQ